ncbi:condensation domain-containing protein [Streptomyces sp. NPDC047017]|uniref:phthiocerol/phthiodiolone dimycocerosyl transferase family protein n=1 Tax=Streptomyces sp. NPDC047017 TaxID=3155024 RepID=UPI003404AF51
MTRQRLISPFESIYFLDLGAEALPLYNMPAFVESLVRGRPDPGLMRRALGLLTERHPILRCEVTSGEEGLLLRSRDRVEPPLTVLDGVEETYAELINTRPDWAESLLHAWLLTDGERSQVVLAVHHGVADGRSAFALLDEFWQYYTALAAGADPAPERREELSAAIDTRLAGSFPDAELDALVEAIAQGADETKPAVLPTEGMGRPGRPAAARRFVVDRLEFAAETTDAVVAAARTREVTVNSLVTGLVLTAVRAQLAPEHGPLTLTCGHGVDLRTRLTPQLPLSTVLNCITGLQTTLPVSHDDRPETVGRQVADQVTGALARRDPERFLLAALRAGARGIAVPVPAVSYGISNVGRIPAHPVPDDMELLRFGGTANAPGMPPKIGVASFGGRLLVQNEYDSWTYAPDQMGRLRETLRAALTGLATH